MSAITTPTAARWPVFVIPPTALPAWQRLTQALDDDHAPPCDGYGEAMFDPAFTELAEHLCLDCPAMLPCDAYATAAGESDDVWGGRLRTRPSRRRREP